MHAVEKQQHKKTGPLFARAKRVGGCAAECVRTGKSLLSLVMKWEENKL
jgi:hypothetical protein